MGKAMDTVKYKDMLLVYKDQFQFPVEWLEPQCLAWSANHEHAVFSIEDEIHPKAVCIWLGYTEDSISFTMICKIQLQGGYWELSEISKGQIPLVNNNPFDPRKENAASNTAVSVFPQNQ